MSSAGDRHPDVYAGHREDPDLYLAGVDNISGGFVYAKHPVIVLGEGKLSSNSLYRFIFTKAMEDLQLEFDFNWPPLTASRHYNVFSFAFIYLTFLGVRFVVGGFFFQMYTLLTALSSFLY